MAGGVFQIVGLVGLLALTAELAVRRMPRALGKLPRPTIEPEVDAFRRTGAL